MKISKKKVAIASDVCLIIITLCMAGYYTYRGMTGSMPTNEALPWTLVMLSCFGINLSCFFRDLNRPDDED